MNKANLKLGTSAVLVTMILCSSIVMARQSENQRTTSADRTAPPVALACERNQLTSYNGEVSDYTRTAEATSLTINTDWDSTETVTIQHAPPDGPRHYFMLNGQAFHKSDWNKIEAENGALLQNVRAIAWVCNDGKTPTMIDWQPS